MIGLIQALLIVSLTVLTLVESHVRPLRLGDNFKDDLLHEWRTGVPYYISKLLLLTLFIVVTFIGVRQNAKTEVDGDVNSSQVEYRGQ